MSPLSLVERIKYAWIRFQKRTPVNIQFEITECGAVCLGTILAYYGRHVASDQLRYDCGVSRDGSNAFSLIQAAQNHGLEGDGFQASSEELEQLHLPAILFWEGKHFVVLESLDPYGANINDPASGRHRISRRELEKRYSSIAIELKPGPDFEPAGRSSSLYNLVADRLRNVRSAIRFLFLLQFLLVLTGLLPPVFSRIFLDNVIGRSLFDWVDPLAYTMLTTAFVSGFLTLLGGQVGRRLRTKLAVVFSSRFLWHTLCLPLRFFLQRFGGEVVSRMGLNNSVTQALSGQVTSSVINLILIVVYAILLVQYDGAISGLAFATAGLNLAMIVGIGFYRQNAYSRLQQEQARLTGTSIDILRHIESIKAAGTEGYFFSRIMGQQTRQINAWQTIGATDAWVQGALSLTQGLSSLALVAVGSWRVMHGSLTVGMFIAFQMLLSQFLHPFSKLAGLGLQIQNLRVDLARLNDVLESPVDSRFLSSIPESPLDSKAIGLDIDGITFGYSPVAPPLFEGLSLSVRRGERVALVGRSGAGKSSLAQLAAANLKPWKGEVRYGGRPGSAWNREQLSSMVRVIDQQLFLFEGSVLDNVSLWDSSISKERVSEALEAADLLEDVLAREGGLHSELSEAGANFSGGQRQRLEIARALLSHPKVLIMDEATSALDRETEARVLSNISQRNCACLIITHRLQTIQNCDRIYVLDQGQLVESGTHRELLQLEGIYSQLYNKEKFT